MRHPEPRLRSYSVVHPPGQVQLPSQPGWQHLLWAVDRPLVASSSGQRWTVPAGWLLVIPPDTVIEVTTSRRRSTVRCLYLGPGIARPGGEVSVMRPSPFGAALLHQAIDTAPSWGRTGVERAMITLLLAEVLDGEDTPLSLPLPQEARCRALAERILSDPAVTIASAAADVGAARRTLERLFPAEVGLTVGRWQRRARMLRAVELLGSGDPVSQVAATVGYSTPSAFTVAFRQELGQRPSEH